MTLSLLLSRLGFLIFVYTIGIVLGFFVLLLRVSGRLQVHGRGHLEQNTRLVVFSNHPSLLDPILVPLVLFTPGGFLHPFSLMPWTAGDKSNFSDPWFGFLFRCARLIPIDRTATSGKRKNHNREALNRMISIASNGGNLIFFPEGTRTEKTTDFHILPNGKRLGHFQGGIELLLRRTHSTFVPVWVEGTDDVFPRGSRFPHFRRSRITVTIGKPFIYNEETFPRSAQERRCLLENKLIELAQYGTTH